MIDIVRLMKSVYAHLEDSLTAPAGPYHPATAQEEAPDESTS